MPRYAIYFVPASDSLVYRIGATLLGYDVYGGSHLPFPEDQPLDENDWCALTTDPRIYGFHATMKAPFRLTPGRSQEELAARLTAFAATHHAVAITPTVRTISAFAALIPNGSSPSLNQLAADCVRAFDDFRAPLNEAERSKRLAAPLTDRQKENVAHWGYPYVFDDFRFHMTLTGRIPPVQQDAVLAYLRDKFDGIDGEVLMIDHLALLCQPDRNTPFRLIMSEPLSAR